MRATSLRAPRRALPAVAGAVLIALLGATSARGGETHRAGPDDYRAVLSALRPGDTLILAAGSYEDGLDVRLKGTQAAPITVAGERGGKTVFLGRAGANTIALRGCAHLVLRDLVLDANGVAGVAGVKAMTGAPCHHITLERLVIRGHGDHQQTCGISTKTPCWDWTIRRCRIERAGTGMYLGNSDGSAPFVRGVVEYCTVVRPKGYALQIKRQNVRPDVAGIPTTRSRTILRYNVLVKDDAVGESGARPSLLLGAFPPSGPGADDLYEVYGNALLRNGTESLMQVCGRATIHDNVFAGAADVGLRAMAHDGRPVRELRVYHNTFVSCAKGAVSVSGLADGVTAVVAGNLCVAAQGGKADVTLKSLRLLRWADPAPGRFDPQPARLYTARVGRLAAAIRGDTHFDRDFWGSQKRRVGVAGAIHRPGKPRPIGLDPPDRGQ